MRLRATQLRPGGGLQPLAGIINGLFANGEQGVWYDPSDLTTLYQDAAGTIPVSAVEQPVGLMLDKSKGLVLGEELATSGLDFNTWQKTAAVTSVGVGTFTTSGEGGIYQWVSGVKNIAHYQVRVVGSTPVSMTIRNSNGTSGAHTVSPGAFDVTLRSQLFAEGEAIYFLANGAGTVNITSLSIRELPGNHATQTTTTSRPVLSARVNLLTKTEDFAVAVWTKERCSISPNVIAAPDGTLTAAKVVEDTTSEVHRLEQNATVVAGVSYTISVAAKKAERRFLRLFEDSAIARAVFDLETGVVSSVASATAAIKDIGNGWFRCSVTYTQSGTLGRFRIAPQASAIPGAYLGDGTSGIYIWGADFRPANTGINLPDYQRVNTATDYDTAGFPLYLKFDGVDDFLGTPSIDFTGTDKMMVCAGVRKLSDAALGMIAELSADSSNSTNPGSFYLVGPRLPSLPSYQYNSRGGAPNNANPAASGFSAPVNSVVSGISDISQDFSRIRVNGLPISSSFIDQGTGTYGNYPLYIGRRAGALFSFNGHLYGLIIRGAATDDSKIRSVERYINSKTKAF